MSRPLATHQARSAATPRPLTPGPQELYLSAVSRPPSAAEQRNVLNHLAGKRDAARAQAVQDVAWALLNTKEFTSNH